MFKCLWKLGKAKMVQEIHRHQLQDREAAVDHIHVALCLLCSPGLKDREQGAEHLRFFSDRKIAQSPTMGILAVAPSATMAMGFIMISSFLTRS